VGIRLETLMNSQKVATCHCEERSDEAIHKKSFRLLAITP